MIHHVWHINGTQIRFSDISYKKVHRKHSSIFQPSLFFYSYVIILRIYKEMTVTLNKDRLCSILISNTGCKKELFFCWYSIMVHWASASIYLLPLSVISCMTLLHNKEMQICGKTMPQSWTADGTVCNKTVLASYG